MMFKNLLTKFRSKRGNRNSPPALLAAAATAATVAAAGAVTVSASTATGEDKKIPVIPLQSRGRALYSSTSTSTSATTSATTYASHLPLTAASARFNPYLKSNNNSQSHSNSNQLLKRTQQLDVVSHVNPINIDIDNIAIDPMLLALPAAFIACSCLLMPSIMLKAASSTRHHLNTSGSQRSMLFSPLILGIAAAAAAPSMATATLTEAEAATVQAKSPSGGYCPAYGCAMTPQDILNGPVQEALMKIRDSTKPKLRTRETKQLVLQQLQSSGDESKATLTLTGYKGGEVEDQINQDRAFVISPFLKPTTEPDDDDDMKAHRLMGVFDGHATYGEVISEFCMTEVPKMLAARLSERLTPNVTEKDQDDIVTSTFDEIYTELDQTAPYGESGGTTASVVLQMGKKLYLASTGDSPSFVCVYHAATKTTEVVYITPDHKPDLPDERARIERMGGRVWIPTMRGAAARVLFTDPETGDQTGIAMSRSIGDRDVGKYGVIANPVVQVIDLEELVQERMEAARTKRNSGFGGLFRSATKTKGDTKNDDDDDDLIDDVHIFVVSASDGMMDILNPKGIAKFLVPSLCKENGMHLLTACEKLISTAAEGWKRASQDGNYRDDIAISVSKIRTPSAKRYE